MKRLVLMRHAKSDWSQGSADIARSLNRRGQRSAKALGDWLRTNGISPDEVLCSEAMRTQETLAGLGMAEDVPTTVTRTLYLAEPEAMAEVLRAASGDCVLMVAHNPGTAMLAQQLVTAAPSHPDFSRYPTCATLVIDFDIAEWEALAMGTGAVVDFVTPRELTD